MTLATYISDLLYRYECVIVPEFGAFLANKQSASIDSSSHILVPPRKVISFNEQLKNNDGLLANHIASNKSISYAEAVVLIEEFVAKLKERMVEGESVLLEKIGHFALNIEGKLQFSPLEGVNYLTSSFGLEPTIKQPILREVYKEEVEVLEEKAPIVFTPEERKKRPYLKYAAAAVILLSLAGLGNQYRVNVNEEIEKENAIGHVKNEKIAIEEASFFSSAPVEVPEVTFSVNVVKKNTGNFHIVAGAFRFEENADKKIEQLESAGFSPRKIGKNKYGLHQVVYASFETREEAVDYLQQIKEEADNKAWLLIKDLEK